MATGGIGMKTLRNQQGIALVTALMLTLISLGMVMALMHLVLQQAKISGAHKLYKNSLEAAHGGAQLITKELIPMMFSPVTDPKALLTTRFSSIGLDTSSNACLGQKLSLPTSQWTACGSGSKSFDPKVDFDMTFKLQGVGKAGFNVYAKIVDTQPGNSDVSGVDLLDSGSGVTGSSAGVNAMHIPAIYRIETEGESTASGKEKAGVTVFYSY